LRSKLRTLADHGATAVAIFSTVLVIAPLVAIFIYLVYKGASSLNLDFFIKVPKPVGEAGGGMANAIVGSGILLGLAVAPNWPMPSASRPTC
jgi:phosphate transport system permease protein